jgi:hypothetical protein
MSMNKEVESFVSTLVLLSLLFLTRYHALILIQGKKAAKRSKLLLDYVSSSARIKERRWAIPALGAAPLNAASSPP